MTKTSSLSRRAWLSGVGASAALSPCLPLFQSEAQARPQGARAEARARRLVVFHSPNGIGTWAKWQPTGGERDFKLSRILAPLEPVRNSIVVLDGVGLAGHTGGAAHFDAQPELLTARPTTRVGPGNADTRATGLSVDQHIANHIGSDTRFPSLQLGVSTAPKSVVDGIAAAALVYAGPRRFILAQDDPYAVFDRLFGGIAGATSLHPKPADQIRSEQRSVLDFVAAELRRLHAAVPASERPKLTAHLETIRRIEGNLDPHAAQHLTSCTIPTVGDRIDWQARAHANIPHLLRLQMDMLVAALACDLTRVVTLQFGCTIYNGRFVWLGINEGHHDLNHRGRREDELKVNEWTAGQVAYLLDRLAQTPDGEGSLLDRTAFAWVNEFGDGDRHNAVPIPVVLAGGAFRTGRVLRYSPVIAHGQVLLSLCHAMGVDDKTFGKPEWCPGPVPGLV